MKNLLIIICLFNLISSLHGQCNYSLSFKYLGWEGKSMTLKWECTPKPQTGRFEIYRKSLSKKQNIEKRIYTSTVNTNFEFADNDKSLSFSNSYEYQIRYVNGREKCSTIRGIQTRVIESDSTYTIPSKDLISFNQKDFVSIKSTTRITKSGTFLPIQIEVKNQQFDFTQKLNYVLIYDGKVIETSSESDSNDFKIAKVYIIGYSNTHNKFRIALVQGNDILGISNFIIIKD
jgi:hypothetical protein